MFRIWFEHQWQTKSWAQVVLTPLSWLFACLAATRRFGYHIGWLKSQALPIPVIVVGNISVGGVGKTPLVVYLAQQLKSEGYAPGVLSRGYGGQQVGAVTSCSQPDLVGDEPVLIARRSGCPVWVDSSRVSGGAALLEAHPDINVIICDDGLQHYALRRDIEIAVVQRPLGLGNGKLLPAGPLRESLNRLQQVDVVVESGQVPMTLCHPLTYQLSLRPGEWTSVTDFSTETTIEVLRAQPLVAIAGIGHPQRFFDQLTSMGLNFEPLAMADHYSYSVTDFEPLHGKTILMTEKDAVKCRHLGLANAWFLPVSAVLEAVGHHQPLLESILKRIEIKHTSMERK